MLHKLAELDLKVREAYENFDFARVVAALTAFMNADLSAFYFDIRKDALYCDPPSSVRRRGALEAIEHIFRAVTVWLAPVLVFTTEEAWSARDAAHRSIHLEQFPAIPAAWRDDELAAELGDDPDAAARRHRRDRDRSRRQAIGSSLEAAPRVYLEQSRASEGARRRRFRRGLHHLGHRDRVRDADARRRRFACRKRRTSASSWSARGASNARARGAISIPRPLRPIFPT